MTLFIPRSRRDREAEGATIGIPRGLNPLLCPIRATEAWLEWGAVFRRLNRGGALEDRLLPQGVWWILRRRAEMARLTVGECERLSAQGLRAGFITEAYRKAAPDEQVMHHTRQKRLTSAQAYRLRARIHRSTAIKSSRSPS
ncbi:hypothetical protein [Roseomonas indoligenes]|uniref:hypothetical protein n=1 Tax=Roseomonas indoligenes TaxID=2820811 RepID=UPI001FD7FBC4|nr:hypothetical protein [Pararoseomonas indoligenes]